MLASDLTHMIADYIDKTDYADFPDKIVEKSKLCLLDWIGVTLAGSKESMSDSLRDLFGLFGGKITDVLYSCI